MAPYLPDNPAAHSPDASAHPACRSCPRGAASVLGGLSEDTLAGLEGEHRVVPYRKGDGIYSEGDAAGSLYCVFSGRVRLYRLTPLGGVRVLRFVSPSQLFGHAEVLSGTPRPVTAEAVEPALLCRFSARGVLDVARREPTFALALTRAMAGDLRRTEDLLLDVASPMRHRVARLLLELDACAEDEIPMSRLEMSQILGTTPETLTRVLSEMDRNGLIRRTRRRLRVSDRGALTLLARRDLGG